MKDIKNPHKEIIEFVAEEQKKLFDLCYQCGLCTGSCPWNLVRDFSMRKLIHETRLGTVNIIEDEAEIKNWYEKIWLCTTCGSCSTRCPRETEIIEIVKTLRKFAIKHQLPDSLKNPSASLNADGNPCNGERENRTDWAKDLNIKTFTKDTNLLFFPCCIPAYDPRAKKMAIAMVKILKKAKVDFGILGVEESCCGESVRKTGSEDLFQKLAKQNIDVFNKSEVKKILTLSPHCYHTFKNEYPELEGKFEVIHYTQYLAQLIKEGVIKPKKELQKKVTYHDPCYLGRHNNVYEEPREILKSIPGLELIEMPDSRQESLCCGGGGGRFWMETKKEERFSDIRIEQAIEIGTDILATACPYCLVMFTDSASGMEEGNIPEIKDIAEIVEEVI